MKDTIESLRRERDAAVIKAKQADTFRAERDAVYKRLTEYVGPFADCECKAWALAGGRCDNEGHHPTCEHHALQRAQSALDDFMSEAAEQTIAAMAQKARAEKAEARIAVLEPVLAIARRLSAYVPPDDFPVDANALLEYPADAVVGLLQALAAVDVHEKPTAKHCGGALCVETVDVLGGCNCLCTRCHEAMR